MPTNSMLILIFTEMKQCLYHIIAIFFLGSFLGLSQNSATGTQFKVKGRVQMKDDRAPISGVMVSTSSGIQTFTDGLGEFEINTAIGELLTIEDLGFQTVRLRIGNK